MATLDGLLDPTQHLRWLKLFHTGRWTISSHVVGDQNQIFLARSWTIFSCFFRQEIKPPCYRQKKTSFFWWQKKPAIFGEVGPFLCWPKLCISLGMEGHLEPCHWPSSAMLLASKTSDFFIGIWSIFGHFCANKMAIFSQEISSCFIGNQNWPLLTEVRPSPGTL